MFAVLWLRRRIRLARDMRPIWRSYDQEQHMVEDLRTWAPGHNRRWAMIPVDAELSAMLESYGDGGFSPTTAGALADMMEEKKETILRGLTKGCRIAFEGHLRYLRRRFKTNTAVASWREQTRRYYDPSIT